jgi:hypothetical protein
MCFANYMIVIFKGSNKTLPIVRTDTSERGGDLKSMLL